MTPDFALWARLEKWLRGDSTRTFEYWFQDGEYTIASDEEVYYGRIFNAGLRKFLKGVGA